MSNGLLRESIDHGLLYLKTEFIGYINHPSLYNFTYNISEKEVKRREVP